jgi:hypothetical protein
MEHFKQIRHINFAKRCNSSCIQRSLPIIYHTFRMIINLRQERCATVFWRLGPVLWPPPIDQYLLCNILKEWQDNWTRLCSDMPSVVIRELNWWNSTARNAFVQSVSVFSGSPDLYGGAKFIFQWHSYRGYTSSIRALIWILRIRIVPTVAAMCGTQNRTQIC